MCWFGFVYSTQRCTIYCGPSRSVQMNYHTGLLYVKVQVALYITLLHLYYSLANTKYVVKANHGNSTHLFPTLPNAKCQFSDWTVIFIQQHNQTVVRLYSCFSA